MRSLKPRFPVKAGLSRFLPIGSLSLSKCVNTESKISVVVIIIHLNVIIKLNENMIKARNYLS